ncbi:hypothetical protein KSP39_PZI005729 [Platanthera zijinensis]|uniref:Uncharacterized protein n=1 Tax=Platanthera zijinensis TaxID=2320716 RepID=A0AAP0BTF2_9ASPA
MITILCRFAGMSPKERDICTLVGHHITETVIFKNIKVGMDRDALALSAKGQSSTTSTDHIDVDIPMADCGIDPDVLMENIEYMKAYLQCQHIYFESRFEQARQERVMIMHKAKILIVEPQYKLQSQFNEEGYLLNIDGSRVDPTVWLQRRKRLMKKTSKAPVLLSSVVLLLLYLSSFVTVFLTFWDFAPR